MQILIKIKQYGFANSLKRVFKKLVKTFGIQVESYYFMKTKLDINSITSKMEMYDYSNVKELVYEDFLKGDSNVFTKSKLERIKLRFESGKYQAYGIIQDEILAYSCWINGNKLVFPTVFNKTEDLCLDEGLLEDDYCHPVYRGRGYHNKMNVFRLGKMTELGFTSAITFISVDNIPAYKTQVKSGLTIENKYTFLKLFSRSFLIQNLH